MKNKKTLTQEHKERIGLANSIANKGKHCSPNTEFKKGITPWNKGKELPQLQGQNHGAWKNGRGGGTWRRIAKRGNKDLSTCQICNDKGNMVVHHIDGNRENNNLRNLGIVCSFCHNAMHDSPSKIANRFGGELR